jgi:FtsP/CotA-like multicopper oxidase with cupredoxin domain
MKQHQQKSLSRRHFLLAGALAGGSLLLSRSAGAQNSMSMPMHTAATPALNEGGPADVTLRISPVLVDVNNDKTISTIGYNGQVPGPLIRMREGKPISVKINGGKGGFNIWTINGQPYDESEPIKIQQGHRYRLAFVKYERRHAPLTSASA